MAGHSTTHPFLKSFDELKRTYNRLENYLNMYESDFSEEKKTSIRIILISIDAAIAEIPEEFHVTRWNQFNK